jgi:NitT/TauT family transport system permease protein
MSAISERRTPAEPRPAEHAVFRWLRRAVVNALPIVALVLLWWGASGTSAVSNSTLVSPWSLIERFGTLWDKGYQGVPLVQQIGASMLRTLAGFLAAALIGVPAGLLMGMSTFARWLLNPILSLLRPIPAIAFIPLFIIWFGIGEFSKVLVIFLSSFLYITVTTEAAVYSIPAGWQRVAVNMGASRAALFRRVIFPASLPGIITGLRIGLALSWALVVAAELIGAQRGLGFMIMDASVFFRVEDVYIGIICIGIIGVVLNGVLNVIERKLCHWRGK